MYNPSYLTEALINTVATGLWEHAPKPIWEALEACDMAYTVEVNAVAARDDAKLELLQANADYGKMAKDAMRNDKDLPDDLLVKKAGWKLENAEEDLRSARTALSLEKGTLAQLLGNADLRDAWRKAVTAQAEKHRDELKKMVGKVTTLQAELIRTTSLSYFLGDFGAYPGLPPVTDANPATALVQLASVEPWSPPKPAETKTRWATPTEEDTRSGIWITNAGGATHLVSAADAERLLKTSEGFRPASDDEIKNEQRRQAAQSA